jgi:hypothetical protein
MFLYQRRAGSAHRMMEMAVVEIIDMVGVFEGGVPAVCAVLVTLVGMGRDSAHS